MIKSGIYKILNLVTGMFYIGQAKNFVARWNKHEIELNKNIHCNQRLQRAWNKYGSKSFEFIAIEGIEDLTKLTEREQWWINETKCCKIGYNINPTASSLLGTKQTKEHIEKRLASRTIWKHTEETKKKMSAAKLGMKLRLGIKHTEETKAKISAAKKGYKHTEEVKELCRLAAIGASRNYDKWPHGGGKECRCEECMEKKRICDRSRKRIKRKCKNLPNLKIELISSPIKLEN